jgi:hypothetical protein
VIEFPYDAGAQLALDTLSDREVDTRENLQKRIENYDGDLWMDFFGPLMDRLEEALGYEEES